MVKTAAICIIEYPIFSSVCYSHGKTTFATCNCTKSVLAGPRDNVYAYACVQLSKLDV